MAVLIRRECRSSGKPLLILNMQETAVKTLTRDLPILVLATVLVAAFLPRFTSGDVEAGESEQNKTRTLDEDRSKAATSRSDETTNSPNAEEPPEPKGLKVFRDAAEGRFSSEGTGDPIRDEVLRAIREKGSIASRLPTDPWDHDGPDADAGAGGRGGNSPQSRKIPPIDGSRSNASQKATAAEQILRAARLLEKVGENDPGRVTLIRQMRSEAGRLLRD